MEAILMSVGVKPELLEKLSGDLQQERDTSITSRVDPLRTVLPISLPYYLTGIWIKLLFILISFKC